MPRRVDPPRSEWLASFLLMVVLATVGFWLIFRPAAPRGPMPPPRPRPPAVEVPVESVLFCTWNVENLFDDRDDPRSHDEDEDWFGRSPDAVRQKLDLLARVLIAQNGGRGPDILAIVEVENRRAVELLRETLNSRLPTEWRYDGVIHRDNVSGRRIEPAVITRLPIRDDLTRDFGPRRILEAHVEARGAPLVILISHWTSRVRDGTEEKRAAYAETLYDAFLRLARGNPAVDVLIAGDFNDEPEDPSLRNYLHTTDEPSQARAGAARPLLFDLTARLDPQTQGTYFYSGHWQILDHIIASPGLLDPTGWEILPETLHTENDPELRFGRNRRPWRFGGPKSDAPRGPSDHFALTVRLRINP